MFANLFYYLIILKILIKINCDLIPQLDENYYKIQLNEKELLKHNAKQNIECEIENKEIYKFSDHNFNQPKSIQLKSLADFYPSIAFINQEIEYPNNVFKINYCLGVILNERFVLTFTSCLKTTKLQTVIRYGAISNNCTGCSITVAKKIISNKELSLIKLKFPIKYNKIKEDPNVRLSQSVGPVCIDNNLKNRNFSLLNWIIQITHGLDENKIDYLYHKPTKIGRLGRQLITINYKNDKINSESFLFKISKEKLYLIGICNIRQYLNYYCFNIDKYKKFINNTINSMESYRSNDRPNYSNPFKSNSYFKTRKCNQ